MTAAESCPVCEEPLTARPATCFRCESRLGEWWPLVDASGVAPATPAAPVRRPLGLLAGVAVASAVLTLAVATAVPRTPPRPHTPPVTLASPAVAAAPAVARPAVVVYTVQRGDSPWRIAAALTGDGRRWRELDVSGHLRPGQRVTMRLDR